MAIKSLAHSKYLKTKLISQFRSRTNQELSTINQSKSYLHMKIKYFFYKNVKDLL